MRHLLFLFAFFASSAFGQGQDAPWIKGATDDTRIGNSSDRLKVEATGSGTFTVSGTVTSNQGTQGTNTSPWYINLRNNAGTEIGTSGAPVRIDPTGTTTQPISAASLPLPTGASTSANQTTIDGHITDTNGTKAPGTAATKSQLTGCVYTSAGVTLTDGQQAACQMTTDGKMKVDTSVLGGQFVPTITNKFRVRYDLTDQTVGAAYSTVYSRSGTGLFFGFQADYNSANVEIRVTIDSGQIFDVTIADLKLFQFNDTTTTRMQSGGFWTTVGNTVDFSLKFPIPYTSSVLIENKRTDGTSHTMSQYMIFLTEDS